MSAPVRSVRTTMCGIRPGSWRRTGMTSGCGDHSATSRVGASTSAVSNTTEPFEATMTDRPLSVPASPPSLPSSSRPRTASTTSSGAPCCVSFSATARTRRSSSVSAFAVVCVTSAQTVAYGPGAAKTCSRKDTSMSPAYPPPVGPHTVSDPGTRGSPTPMTEHDTLPLPDYDQLPIEGLTHRIRMLDATGVQTLLDYERAHANRANAVTILENRLAGLRDGAQPSGGDPLAPAAD